MTPYSPNSYSDEFVQHSFVLILIEVLIKDVKKSKFHHRLQEVQTHPWLDKLFIIMQVGLNSFLAASFTKKKKIK